MTEGANIIFMHNIIIGKRCFCGLDVYVGSFQSAMLGILLSDTESSSGHPRLHRMDGFCSFTTFGKNVLKKAGLLVLHGGIIVS